MLDEHTAALDARVAKQVMIITKKLVDEQKITTLMISHNMNDAIYYGDRLLLLSGGEIIMDVSGAQKAALTPAELITRL